MTPFLPATILLFILTLSGCKKSLEAKDPRIEPELVQVVQVHGASRAGDSFTGVVAARVQSDLGFRVPGKVTQRLVDVGQAVRMGQPLMRIDVTDYAHAVTTQTQNVEAAKVKAAQTAADEVRYRGLVSTGAVSALTYDQVKAAADAARAQLAAAVSQLQVAKDEGDYSLLVADADGIVTQTFAEPGQVVAAGQSVVKLAHAGPREAAVYLPETVRPALGSGAVATLFGKSMGVGATLRQLSDSADPQTRTFEARYVLSGPGAESAPLGATVKVQLRGVRLGSDRDLGVPLSALIDRGQGPGVWFVKSGASVSFRPVKIARLGEEEAYLASGIEPGDEIVALGAHLLNEGQKVRVIGRQQNVAAR